MVQLYSMLQHVLFILTSIKYVSIVLGFPDCIFTMRPILLCGKDAPDALDECLYKLRLRHFCIPTIGMTLVEIKTQKV